MPIGTYTPPRGKSITQFFFFKFFHFFFHFRCILLQISHQKCFFISISIPGRSGVNISNFLFFCYYFLPFVYTVWDMCGIYYVWKILLWICYIMEINILKTQSSQCSLQNSMMSMFMILLAS